MISISRGIFTGIKKVNYLILRHAQSNVVVLDENTVTGRLLIHLRKPYQHSKHENRVRTKLIPERQSETYSTVNLLKLQELPEDLQWQEVQKIDGELFLHSREMNTKTILDILSAYMTVISNKITKLLFYKSAMKYFSNRIEFMSFQEKIRFMFYVSLQKKNRNAQKALSNCLRTLTSKQIEQLSIEDLCVICNSTFKTSTRISNAMVLNKIIDTINNNLDLLKDPGFLITLIKTLRHNKYQNEDVLSTIACAVLFNATYEYYDFIALCHILALYADYLYYDENILKLFVEKCIELLKKDDEVERRSIRLKDVKRLLWCCSKLGYKIKKDDIEEIVIPKILEKMGSEEFFEDPEFLIDCIMYLWILNYQAKQLVPYCFKEEAISQIRNSTSKTAQRLNLLLTCMQLENFGLYRTLGVKPEKFSYFDMKLQISTRPYLQRVYYALKQIQPETPIDKFTYECEIPHLKIVGITGFTKIYKKVFIEVLDDQFCVKNRKAFAAGLMQLKLRLLDDMDQALIIVPNIEIDEMTDKQLEDYMKSELKMVL